MANLDSLTAQVQATAQVMLGASKIIQDWAAHAAMLLPDPQEQANLEAQVANLKVVSDQLQAVVTATAPPLTSAQVLALTSVTP